VLRRLCTGIHSPIRGLRSEIARDFAARRQGIQVQGPERADSHEAMSTDLAFTYRRARGAVR
jgi:hypothetical protein